MDRDQLMSLLRDLTDGTLTVGPGGMIQDTGGAVWPADQVGDAVEEVLTELRAGLARLAKVVTWAKLAPEYAPPTVGVPVRWCITRGGRFWFDGVSDDGTGTPILAEWLPASGAAGATVYESREDAVRRLESRACLAGSRVVPAPAPDYPPNTGGKADANGIHY